MNSIPTTGQWHAEPALLKAYLDGRLDAILGASLERHIDGCARCRTAIADVMEPALLDAAWTQVRHRVEVPQPPRLVRFAQRLGLPDWAAVLLSASASLRLAWLVGAVVALGFATVAAVLSQGAIWPFLLVAPLMPVIGVALAYGDGDDPFEALAVPTPVGRPRLILLRTIGVVVTAIPPAIVLGLFLPGPTWIAVAWLGPALAMIPMLLALAGVIGARYASTLLSLAWIGIVILSMRRLPDTWPVAATQQGVYLALAVVSMVVIAHRARAARQIGAVL